MAITLRTRLVAHLSKARRPVAIGVAFLMAGGLATGITQAAGAEPQPTIAQVQAEVNALTAKFNKACTWAMVGCGSAPATCVIPVASPPAMRKATPTAAVRLAFDT